MSTTNGMHLHLEINPIVREDMSKASPWQRRKCISCQNLSLHLLGSGSTPLIRFHLNVWNKFKIGSNTVELTLHFPVWLSCAIPVLEIVLLSFSHALPHFIFDTPIKGWPWNLVFVFATPQQGLLALIADF
jgi:hypothetical protein